MMLWFHVVSYPGVKSSLRSTTHTEISQLKIHDKKPRRYHHCHILNKYDILNFVNLIKHSNVCLLFKIIHNAASPPLKKYVVHIVCTYMCLRSHQEQQDLLQGVNVVYPDAKLHLGSHHFLALP